MLGFRASELRQRFTLRSTDGNTNGVGVKGDNHPDNDLRRLIWAMVGVRGLSWAGLQDVGVYTLLAQQWGLYSSPSSISVAIKLESRSCVLRGDILTDILTSIILLPLRSGVGNRSSCCSTLAPHGA